MERMKKPKFIKEIEKSEGKERAKCGRWYIRVYGELDHKPMVELESLEIVVKELHKVEQENKNLRAYADNLDSENDNQAIEIEELKKENKKLKKYYDRDKEELMESCYGLARENDKLKSDLMEDMKEITKLEKENKKLKKELEKLKSTYVYDAKQVRDIC